jgi:hypothetical protein
MDFQDFQQELDSAFHSRGERVVAGSAEHAELLTFSQRFMLMK